MRVLFTFIGGLGHFYPLAPVARAAAAAGHEVAVAGSGGLVARIEEAGFRAFATSPLRAPAPAAAELTRTPLEVTAARAAEVEFAENFAGKGTTRHATAVQEVIRAWHPDVVVRDEADFGSAIAAEVLGVPAVTVLVLAAGTLVRPDLVTPPLARLRAEHGLVPDTGPGMLLGDTVLAPFPPTFRSPDSPVPLPERTRWYRPGRRVVARRRRPGRPRVYATLGTVFNAGSGDLFERLLTGLGALDADVLLTVGRTLDPKAFGAQPDHVRIEQFVPQDDVLGDVDVVVSHGGSGSLAASLTHGLPSVLLPLGADQPHNARRAAALGLARVLDATSATPDEIEEAVSVSLLADTAPHRRIADEVDRLPAVEETVAALQAL